MASTEVRMGGGSPVYQDRKPENPLTGIVSTLVLGILILATGAFLLYLSIVNQGALVPSLFAAGLLAVGLVVIGAGIHSIHEARVQQQWIDKRPRDISK